MRHPIGRLRSAAVLAALCATPALANPNAPGAGLAQMEQISSATTTLISAADWPAAPTSGGIAQAFTPQAAHFGAFAAYLDTLALQVAPGALLAGHVSHSIDNAQNVGQIVQVAQVPSTARDGAGGTQLALFGHALTLGGMTPVSLGLAEFAGIGDNLAEQRQTGRANVARIVQLGTDNVARQTQDGTELAAAIIQYGTGNVAQTLQSGALSQAVILQAGRDNAATVQQRSDSAFAAVSQSGTGNIAFIRQ